MRDPAQVLDTSHAVDHLTAYYQHLTTLSAGAIVVVGTFAGNFKANSPSTLLAVAAMFLLAGCILVSTGMMWTYGVARREAASAEAGASSTTAWAFRISDRNLRLAKRLNKILPKFAPATFVGGFGLLASYAAVLLI